METMLTDAQWARLAPLLPGRPGTSGGRGRDNRQFVEAGRWLARKGAVAGLAASTRQLAPDIHALPALGSWQRVFEAVQDEAALHTLLVDSTTVRAQPHASEAHKQTDHKPWAAPAAG